MNRGIKRRCRFALFSAALAAALPCVAVTAQAQTTPDASGGAAVTPTEPATPATPASPGIPASPPTTTDNTVPATPDNSAAAPAPPALSAADQAEWNTIQGLVNAQQYRQAEPRLQTWIKAHPDDRNAQFLLAYSVMYEGKNAAAVDEFNTLLAAEPDNPNYLYGKALALSREGRWADAIPLLDRARTVGTTNTQVVYQLELQALRHTGDTAKLQTIQQEAQTKYPGMNWAAAAAAPATAPLPSFVQLQYTHDTLTHHYQDWNTVDLIGAKTIRPRETVFGDLEDTTRFGLHDDQITAGINYPLTPKMNAVVQGGFSPQHHVLAKYMLLGQLGYALGNGVGVFVGDQHARYDSAAVEVPYIGAEKLWDHYRVADTVSFAHIWGAGEGNGVAVSDTVSLNDYYGPNNQSTVGINFGAGQSPVVVIPRGVFKATTTDIDLTGVHFLNPEWGVYYDLGYHKLGGLYTRHTLGIGVRRQF